MATSSNFYSDGNFQWLKKTTYNTLGSPIIIPPPVLNTLTGLFASNIQSDVIGESFIIVQGGNTLAQFEIKKIASIDLFNNNIIIYSGDELPFTLQFINNTEALNADTALTILINQGDTGSLIGTGIPTETIIQNGNFSKTFTAPIVLSAIGVESNVNQVINIGTTSMGSDIYSEWNINANQGNLIRLDYFMLVNTTFYFSGVQNNTTFKFWYTPA